MFEYSLSDFTQWATKLELSPSDLDFFFLYFDGSKLTFSQRWLVAWLFVENPAIDLLTLEEPAWRGIKEQILKPFCGVEFDSSILTDSFSGLSSARLLP